MQVNSDFSKRVVVHGAELEWINSPMAGVRRRMLDRIGDEVARATSIVKYEPDSHFSSHVHTGGEEFIVLEGVFQDEHGDFPAGSYIRNPPQSSHTPGSKSGCVIFVKLWQFDLADRTSIRVDMTKVDGVVDAARPGVVMSPLFQDDDEIVRMEQWEPGAEVSVDTSGGAEILVLQGGFEESGDHLYTQSWIRTPVGGAFKARVADKGARVWVKTGHLRCVRPPAEER